MRAFLHAMEVQETLDAPAAVGRGNVRCVEITSGGAGVIEVINLADVKFAARIEADAGGDGLAAFFDGGEDGGGAGGELFAGPGFVEALLLENLQQQGEVGVAWGGDPMK